jgi:hypothetical protein
MQTPQEAIAEAKRALNEFMRRERDTSLSRPDCAGATFQTEGGSDTSFDKGDDWGRISEARADALRYIESKANNARPVRQVDESNPAAVEGHIQALTWLQRRGKSRLKP